MLFDKRVPHSDSLAKYAAAFFTISISIFRRATSARSREISICSGVIGLPFSTLPSLPSAWAFTQLRIDCSGTPISRAILRTGSPPRTRRNASSLNSSVYAAFGIFFIQHLQQPSIIPRYRWCPITAGKLDLAAQDSTVALARRLHRYTRCAVLAIDEVGYLSYDPRYADLLFEVITRRYELQRPILLTTNKSFGEWNQVFPNAACVVALVDRLLHRAEIVALDGKSYRFKEAQERAARKAKSRTTAARKTT